MTDSKNLNFKLKTLFHVRVPRRATYSHEELEIVGLVQKFDNKGNPITKKNTSDTEDDLCTCMLPLSKLIDLYCSGTYIALLDSKDSIKVYDILDDYITYFKSAGTYSIHTVDTTDNYLLEQIEKFLTEVYQYNTKVIDRSNVSQINSFTLGFNVLAPLRAEKDEVDKSYLYDNTPSPNIKNKQSWRDYHDE